jgi:uncharacterized protein
MADYAKPLPRLEDPDLTQTYWDAAKRHELLIPRCAFCNKFFWYPRPACPSCLREGWEWTAVSGRARLHTFTTVYQAAHPAFQDDVPYAFAVVQLEEGPRMMSNVVDCDIADVKIDMPLTVKFDDVTDEWTLVKFRPA